MRMPLQAAVSRANCSTPLLAMLALPDIPPDPSHRHNTRITWVVTDAIRHIAQIPPPVTL